MKKNQIEKKIRTIGFVIFLVIIAGLTHDMAIMTNDPKIFLIAWLLYLIAFSLLMFRVWFFKSKIRFIEGKQKDKRH